MTPSRPDGPVGAKGDFGNRFVDKNRLLVGTRLIIPKGVGWRRAALARRTFFGRRGTMMPSPGKRLVRGFDIGPDVFGGAVFVEQ